MRRKVCHERMFELRDTGAKANSRGTTIDNNTAKSLKIFGRGKDFIDFISGSVDVVNGKQWIDEKLDLSSKLLSLSKFTYQFTYETIYTLCYKLTCHWDRDSDPSTVNTIAADATCRKVFRENERRQLHLKPALEMAASTTAHSLKDTLE